jgi:hypothetical protein
VGFHRIAVLLLAVALLPLSLLAELAGVPDNTPSSGGPVLKKPAFMSFPDVPMPEWAQREFNAEITNAAADELFAVEVRFDQPVAIGKLRKVARDFEIPRVVAYVEYSPRGARSPSKLPLALGVFFENGWQQQTCRIRIFAQTAGVHHFADVLPEGWLIREAHVYGAAADIRELRAGTALAPARVIDGTAQERRFLEGMKAAARREMATKISMPDDFVAPDDCRGFVKAGDSPILVGKNPRGLRPSAGLDFRQVVRQQLGELAPTTPVTLSLTFLDNVSVDILASLVEQYRLDGLLAEFTPVNSGRVMVLSELSIHGGPFEEQAKRVRCSIALADYQRQQKGESIGDEWSAFRARVSAQSTAAWQLLSDDALKNAQLVAEFPTGALARLEDYYRRKSSEVIHLQQTAPIPAGCSRFMHEDERSWNLAR